MKCLITASFLLVGCATVGHSIHCAWGSSPGKFTHAMALIADQDRISQDTRKPPDGMDKDGFVPSLQPIVDYGDCPDYAGIVKQYSDLRAKWLRMTPEAIAAREAEVAAEQRHLAEVTAQMAAAKRAAEAAGEEIHLRTSHLGGSPPTADAYYLALIQLTDQYAVFAEANVPFVVAIERDSIDPRIAVTEGMALIKMTHCVRWQRDETWQSDRGFPLPVKVYEAVWCD
jgi:hypothetical protein